MTAQFPLRINDKQRQQFLSWFYTGLAAIALFLVGIGLSNKMIQQPKIGVIYVDQTISPELMPYFSLPISYAMQHSDIVAVVLVIDSPGGTASTSEELFYRITQLRSQKPVVASVNRIGASGAYYAAIGANYIFAKPASLVGSIGVVAGLPVASKPTEFQATTGPFKAGGSNEVDWVRGMEGLKNAFVSHVYEQRIYALAHMHNPSRVDVLPQKDFISTGQIWFAPSAYENGLVDELGSDLDAIQKAADLAHVANYQIIDLTGLTLNGDPTFLFTSDNHSINEQAPGWSAELPQLDPWPNFYHLYLPPGS